MEHGTCEEGWEPFGESCFKFAEETANKFGAEEACKNENAVLTSCLTPHESLFVKQKVSSLKKAFWLGIDRNGYVLDA